jgi:hypothetical protein
MSTPIFPKSCVKLPGGGAGKVVVANHPATMAAQPLRDRAPRPRRQPASRWMLAAVVPLVPLAP